MTYKALLPALAHLLETDELPANLHERHVGGQFRGAVEAASVYMLVGEIIQQVAPGLQTQFLLQQVGPLGTYTRQISKFGVKDRGAH
jgi:hypothetical protein